MPSPPPLTTLLSQALVAFTIEFDNLAEERIAAAGARPWIASQAMWANHLRFVGEDGIPARALMHHSLVSAAAIRSRLGALRRWRYISIDAAHVVRLTAAGRRSRDVWMPLATEVEGRWRERLSSAAIDALSGELAHAANTDAPVPRHLPIVGYAMRSEVVQPPEPIPADDAEPDLSALLARALLALTLAFESGSKLSLPVHVDGLRVLGPGPTRVRDLPRLSGCSKAGMAMITGFLARAGLAVIEPDPGARRGKVVRLTPRGIAAKERGADRIAAAEDRPRDRLRTALEVVLADPALAQGLVPRPGGWRGQAPYRAHTERLVADPRGTLPHHPLMLHRGGFPDGA